MKFKFGTQKSVEITRKVRTSVGGLIIMKCLLYMLLKFLDFIIQNAYGFR